VTGRAVFQRRSRSAPVAEGSAAAPAPASSEAVRLPVHAGYDVALTLLELRCDVMIARAGESLKLSVFPYGCTTRARPKTSEVAGEIRQRSSRVDVVVPPQAPKDETVEQILRELLYGWQHMRADACEPHTIALATVERLLREDIAQSVRVWASPCDDPFSTALYIYDARPGAEHLLPFDILGGKNAPSGRGPAEYLVIFGLHNDERFEPLTQAGCVETIVREARAKFTAMPAGRLRR
jgi:hypothetical protein